MKKLVFAILLVQVLLAGIFFLSSSLPALAAEGERVELVNPLKFIGVNSPGELLVKVFRGFAGLMGAIAIAFVVFSGFKLVIATNEEAVKTAKSSLTWSVGGFIVALLSFTIISGVSKFLGFEPGPVGDVFVNPIKIPGDSGNFMNVLNYVMINFLGILGFATILMIIYYGYRYITSAGNEEAIETAKTGLKWAILGFIVTLLAFTIISGIRQLLL